MIESEVLEETSVLKKQLIYAYIKFFHDFVKVVDSKFLKTGWMSKIIVVAWNFFFMT